MEQYVYQQIFDIEESHWWFIVRRKIISQIIANHVIQPLPKALDIGCGTGLNSRLLKKFVLQVQGLEMAKEAVRLSNLKVPDLRVLHVSFPEAEIQEKFDLVTMFDVLEHLEDDKKSIRRVEEILEPGGLAVLTVPAFKFLWTEHDHVLHHYRRYTKKSLLALIRSNTKLEVEYASYFNTLLFIPIVIFRLLRKVFRFLPGRTDDFAVPKFLNSFFKMIFALDSKLLQFFLLPFGISIICVLKKPKEI